VRTRAGLLLLDLLQCHCVYVDIYHKWKVYDAAERQGRGMQRACPSVGGRADPRGIDICLISEMQGPKLVGMQPCSLRTAVNCQMPITRPLLCSGVRTELG
jgi:hypothetical protein